MSRPRANGRLMTRQRCGQERPGVDLAARDRVADVAGGVTRPACRQSIAEFSEGGSENGNRNRKRLVRQNWNAAR